MNLGTSDKPVPLSKKNIPDLMAMAKKAMDEQSIPTKDRYIRYYDPEKCEIVEERIK